MLASQRLPRFQSDLPPPLARMLPRQLRGATSSECASPLKLCRVALPTAVACFAVAIRLRVWRLVGTAYFRCGASILPLVSRAARARAQQSWGAEGGEGLRALCLRGFGAVAAVRAARGQSELQALAPAPAVHVPAPLWQQIAERCCCCWRLFHLFSEEHVLRQYSLFSHRVLPSRALLAGWPSRSVEPRTAKHVRCRL